MTKLYKAGDVCEIVDTYNKFEQYRGMECTVVTPTKFDVEQYYEISIKCYEEATWTIGHSCLKLIKPGSSDKDEEAFKEFMDKVMTPVELRVEETA